MAELYDVVFYGADNHADSIEKTKKKISKLLKVNGSKLEALFEKKGGTTLRKGVSLTVAKKYQQAIVKAGGRCRFQQVKPKPEKLALEALTSEYICSECEYKQVLENDESEPLTCPECGAGESEHENVVHESESDPEPEKMTYMVTDDGVAKVDLSLLAKQKQKAEEAVASEAVKNTDSGAPESNIKYLFFSAMVGMTLGGGGVFAYNHYIAANVAAELIAEKSAAKLALAEQALRQKQAKIALPGLKPSPQALMNMNRLSQAIVDGSINVNTEAASLPDSFTDVAGEIAANMKNPEQDLTMISLIQRLIEADKLSEAYQVSHSIKNPTWRFNWAGKVAAAFAASGNIDASSMIWTTLRTETNKMPRVHKRIDNLSKLALFHADADDLTGAQMLLQNAESLTKNIPSSAMKALSLGYIAAIQAKIGLQITSENNFAQANQAVTASTNAQARLFAFVELARAYADAGHKSTAFGLLNEVLQTSKQISDPTQRGVLLGQVAYGLFVAGNSQSAFEAIELIGQVPLQDENLYCIIVEQIHTKQLYQAIATTDQLKTAVYQAKAHALLARFFVDTPMDSLVADRFELATQMSGYITDRARQAVAMSEIARYQARARNNQSSSQLFIASFTLAQQLGNSFERDNAFAHIARNQAFVAHIPQAMQTVSQIVDGGLRDSMITEIQAMKKMHRILDSFERSMS